MTLRRQQPDRVPFDLSSTQVTAISNTAYVNLRRYLGLSAAEPETVDIMQQVCVPHEDLLQRLQVGILEIACRLRPVNKLMMDLALGEAAAMHRLAKIAGLKARFWEAFREAGAYG